MRPSLSRNAKCPFVETGEPCMAALCEMAWLSALAAFPAFPFFRNRSPRLSRLSARSRSWAVLQGQAFSRNLTQLASCEPSRQCRSLRTARSSARCAHRTPAWRLTRRSTRTRRYVSSTRRAPVAARRLPCFVRRLARAKVVDLVGRAKCGSSEAARGFGPRAPVADSPPPVRSASRRVDGSSSLFSTVAWSRPMS